MKNARSTVSLFIVVGALALAACSAEVKGGSDLSPAPEKPTDYKDQVAGINLDGNFTSTCLEDVFTDGGRVIHWSISGRNLTRKIETFKDRLCKTLAKTDDTTAQFRFSQKFAQDVYQIEWRYTGNTMGIGSDDVKLDNDRLLIGDGDTSGRVPTLRLYRDGTPTQPAPAPAPAPPALKDFEPSYGDSAEYSGTQTELYTCQGSFGTDDWSVYSETNGIPRGYSHYSSLFSTKKYKAKLAACAQVETVVTPAGAFITCREDDGSHTRWYGNVPIFGLVKMESHDQTYRIQLVKFSLGQ